MRSGTGARELGAEEGGHADRASDEAKMRGAGRSQSMCEMRLSATSRGTPEGTLKAPAVGSDGYRVRASRSVGRPIAVVLSMAVVAFILAGSATAGADTTIVTDAQDASLGPDIASVEVGHGRHDRLRFRITTYSPFVRSDAPCLVVQAGLQREEYSICGDGDVILAGSAKSGEAKVSKPDPAAVVYGIRPQAIGSPSFHRWKVVVSDPACPRDVCDATPDDGWVTHQRWVSYGHWASRFLREMRVPRCSENKVVVVAWEVNEGTAAVWNPLATTYDMPGATKYNSVGVRNYVGLGQGTDASRLTIERGYTIYGYGEIVRRLDRCAPPMKTARAIKQSSWCPGCTGGRYVTGLIRQVKADYGTYADRLIATAL